jgi:protoheme IX farnesyltransferase
MRRREPGAIAATPVTGLSLGAYLELIKPRITTLVVLTTATGLWLAPERPSFRTALFTVLGTILVVAAANVFNMYLERDTDALMPRTMNRPLPAGRIDPACALLFGVLLAAISVPLLTFVVGPLPGLLAALALVIYALVYTPLKRRTTASLLVGAVAGAIPPLIGWTAATGSIDPPALVLFAILFLWQVPHFLAIALFRRTEFARAGLLVRPNEPDGERVVRDFAAARGSRRRVLRGLRHRHRRSCRPSGAARRAAVGTRSGDRGAAVARERGVDRRAARVMTFLPRSPSDGRHRTARCRRLQRPLLGLFAPSHDAARRTHRLRVGSTFAPKHAHHAARSASILYAKCSGLLRPWSGTKNTKLDPTQKF